MFVLKEAFRSYDENLQPYSMRVERHTETANLHAGVTDGGFALKSVGNRHILNSPVFHDGRLELSFHINYMKEYAPRFTVLFGYDEEKRTGCGVRVSYDLSSTVTVELIHVRNSLVTVDDKNTFEGTRWEEEQTIAFLLVLKEEKIRCCVGEREAVFTCLFDRGYVALERSAFIGEWIIERLMLTGEDTEPETELFRASDVPIPLLNGGDIPYRVSWRIFEVGQEVYLQASLDGGTKTRKVDRDSRRGQYVAEKDVMESPYIGLADGDAEQRFCLVPGPNRFIDPNIFWDCQKEFLCDTPLPITGLFRLSKKPDAPQFLFGYKDLTCAGYNCQAGGAEFRFDRQGSLLSERSDQSWEILSPEDKKVLSLIPKYAWHREEIERHLRANHYFLTDEPIRFRFIYRTDIEAAYLSCQADITDVFAREVLTSSECSDSGEAAFAPMPVGVYRIRFRIFYGGKEYAAAENVFEVLDPDTDENPALKTGLPFVFSMPNETKWLMRNSFDLWNPKPSCDVEHFITCITDTPIEAETRRSWEVIKPFKREWFAWLAKRTANDFADDRHAVVRKNADYLFYGIDDGTDDWLGAGSIFPFRADHWEYSRINNVFQRRLLREFIKTDAETASIIGDFIEEKKIPYDVYRTFMQRKGKVWMAYVNAAVLEIFRKQNRELTDENLKVRRTLYGPVNAYVAPAMSYYDLKFFGLPMDPALTDEIYTGFMIFEDYPYSCAYQTYRGAFTMMTLCLHFPKAVIYPEQYKGSPGGCIDGAVKYAHAPMGAYNVEPYQNSTHAFEYVFNTPCLREDGFHYWENYGFHRSDYADDFMNALVKDWWYAVRYRPERPLKTIAFAAEFDESDDVFSETVLEDHNKYALYNRSGMAFGLLHECSREAGLPNGFALKLSGLEQLKSVDCDVLILPSLKNASEKVKAQIRRLYDEGVNLVGMFDVSGLEDIFGVRKQETVVNVTRIEYDGETEYVYPRTASFAYAADTAKARMTVNSGCSALLMTGRTMLINTDIEALGSEDTAKCNASGAYHIVGRLLRKAVSDGFTELSHPLAKGENVGVTVFRARSGETVLMAIDYTPFDNAEHGEKEAVVRLNIPVREAVSDVQLFAGKREGCIKELRFPIKPHGFAFIELKV